MPGTLTLARRASAATFSARATDDALIDPLLQSAPPVRQPTSWKVPLPEPPTREQVERMKSSSVVASSGASVDALDLATPQPAPAKRAFRSPVERGVAATAGRSATMDRMGERIPANDGFGYSGAFDAMVDPVLPAAPGPEPAWPVTAEANQVRRGVRGTLARFDANKDAQRAAPSTMLKRPKPEDPAYFADKDMTQQPGLPDHTMRLTPEAQQTFHAVPGNVALTAYANMATGAMQLAPLIPAGGRSAGLDHEDLMHPGLVVPGPDGQKILNKPIRHTPPSADPTKARAPGAASHEQVAARFEGDAGVADKHQDMLGFSVFKGNDGKVSGLRYTSRTFNDSKHRRQETDHEYARRKETEATKAADPRFTPAALDTGTISATASDIDLRNQARLLNSASQKALVGGITNAFAQGAPKLRKAGARRKKAATSAVSLPENDRKTGLPVDGKLGESWRNKLTEGVVGTLGKSAGWVSDEVETPRQLPAPSVNAEVTSPSQAPLPAPLPAVLGKPSDTTRT